MKEFAKQQGNEVRFTLNHWQKLGTFTPFFDASRQGRVDHNRRFEAIAEVYRAALAFQNEQDDSGRSFRYALEAFAEARSLPVGYALKMLAVMHFLEWLDGGRTMKSKVLAREFDLPEPVANEIMRLRNEVSHNHHDLLDEVNKACARFITAGIDLAGYGAGDENTGLYNYLYSLTGKLLLKKIGADVSPVQHLPGYGEFGAKGDA